MIKSTLVWVLWRISNTVSIVCMFIIITMLAMLNVIDEIMQSIVITDTASRRFLRKIFRSRK